MGKIWVETAYGKLIHLPVQGDDANSCTDVTKVPASVVLNQNRCYGEPIVVMIPSLGTVTIDMRPPGISGLCNQCGMCCAHPPEECTRPADCAWTLNIDIGWHCCPYLHIVNKNKWGQAGNTSCTLYATILDEYKGCAYPPDVIKSWWTGCGYSF